MAYIGNEPGKASQRVVDTFTATASQTTFTPSSGYTLGYVDVYLNGVKLVNGDDYTATNGTTVVLSSGVSANDVVECVAYIPRGLSDGYTTSQADARYAQKSNNLSDLASASTARTNLGLGTLATVSPTGTASSSNFLRGDGSWQTVSVTPTAVSSQANSATDFFALPSGTTAQRPASPANGYMRYNTTTSAVEVYVAGAWGTVSTGIVATGGTIVVSGAYKYHTFTSSGSFVVTSGATNVEYLIIAGGGGGGRDHGGGGGAGGVLSGTFGVSPNTYSMVIGAGGSSASPAGANPTSGNNSTGFGFTAIGGGTGGVSNGGTGVSGGSGGGGGGTNGSTNAGGAGTSGQGFAGGTGGATTNEAGGGGGGAGAVGGSASGGTAGAGGVGTSVYSTWGSATSTGQNVSGTYYYAGGGGGGTNGGGTTSAGGFGGGGFGGGGGSSQGGAGTANTGGGAGAVGNGNAPSQVTGGSGIVIIRYLT